MGIMKKFQKYVTRNKEIAVVRYKSKEITEGYVAIGNLLFMYRWYKGYAFDPQIPHMHDLMLDNDKGVA
jgi:hypothetical protein